MSQIKSELKKSLNVGLTVLFKIISPVFEMGNIVFPEFEKLEKF